MIDELSNSSVSHNNNNTSIAIVHCDNMELS